jgi:hypothetical protein
MDAASMGTVLDGLTPPDGACHFLHSSNRQYGFHTKPALNAEGRSA